MRYLRFWGILRIVEWSVSYRRFGTTCRASSSRVKQSKYHVYVRDIRYFSLTCNQFECFSNLH
jgi:hypothetical protein